MIELYEREGHRRLEHQRRRHGPRRDPRARDRWASPRSRCSWSSTPVATTRTCRASASTTTASCCAIFETVAETGLPLMVHPHDQALMTAIEERYWERGERDFRAYAKAYAAHDGIIWDTAAALLLRLQKATGTQLHLLHTQTTGVIDQLRRGQGRRPGRLGRDQPVGRVPRQRLGEHRAARLLRAVVLRARRRTPSRSGRRLRDGTIDLVSTDHAPHTARGEGARLDRRLEGPHGHAVDPVLPARCSSTRARAGRICARAHRRRDGDRAGPRLRARRQGPPRGRRATPTSPSSTSTREFEITRRHRPQQDRLDAVRRPPRPRRRRPRRSRAARSSTPTGTVVGRPGRGRQATPDHRPTTSSTAAQGEPRPWPRVSDCSSRTSGSRPTRTCSSRAPGSPTGSGSTPSGCATTSCSIRTAWRAPIGRSSSRS